MATSKSKRIDHHLHDKVKLLREFEVCGVTQTSIALK